MSEVIVEAEGVGKKYRLQEGVASYGSLRDAVAQQAARLLRRPAPEPRAPQHEFWALQDVSFDVKRGEVVGVIGRNGAGKSTLLKILSRITEPSAGRVTLHGHVASLLEVGTGFHPELTGRENIFLNGAILGMSRAEITRKFDRIVEFAEVVRFLDMPVKRYSSGMYVRLAFAVAAHLDPEILIVDEVLSVGDAEFQKKCLGAMSDVATKDGRTVLFVSHNMRAIQDLCQSAMLIDGGRIAYRGPVAEGVSKYLANCETIEEWRPDDVSGDAKPFHYTRIAVTAPDGGAPQYDQAVQLTFDYDIRGDVAPSCIVFNIRNADGALVFESAETDTSPAPYRRYSAGAYRAVVAVPPRLLAPGKYFLTVSEPNAEGSFVFHENILSFVIGERGSPTLRAHRPGLITPVFEWNTTKLDA